MKIFVTGASGFVGSTLCDELSKQGHEVCVLIRKTSLSNLTNAKFFPIYGDLQEPQSLLSGLKDADVIFHLEEESYLHSNSGNTKNLLNTILKNGRKLQRFVYVSSLVAAGPSVPGCPLREENPCRPVSRNGVNKGETEKLVLEVKISFPVVIIRAPLVYGPRDRDFFPFFQMARRGLLPLLESFETSPRTYSFVHVQDLVQGILAVGFVEKLVSGSVYYISGDGEYSWEETMGIIAKKRKGKNISLRLPASVLYGVAALGTAHGKVYRKTMPLSLDKLKEIQAPAWLCSNEKAKRELGFQPYWDLKKGLAMTAKWYEENNWL